jgi:hypothetical protein
MSIIEGIDIYLQGVDYDTRHDKLLKDTFDNPECRQELEPLWHIIDVFIDRQARKKELFSDAEEVYMAIEDFCIYKNITNIPSLYKYLFNARKGFLAQAKFPCCIRKQWLNKFPNAIIPKTLKNSLLVQEFKDFMENDTDTYRSVLIDLELFGYEYETSDEEDVDDKWMFG